MPGVGSSYMEPFKWAVGRPSDDIRPRTGRVPPTIFSSGFNTINTNILKILVIYGIQVHVIWNYSDFPLDHFSTLLDMFPHLEMP